MKTAPLCGGIIVSWSRSISAFLQNVRDPARNTASSKAVMILLFGSDVYSCDQHAYLTGIISCIAIPLRRMLSTLTMYWLESEVIKI